MGLQAYSEAKALIFDLDGTLSNSLPVHLATWQQVGDVYHFHFNPQIMLEMTGRATIDFARRIVEENNLQADPADLVKLKQQAFWDSANLLEPINEVIDIVKANYRKLPMAVGTGASRKSTEVQLKQLGIGHFFDAIVTANDVTLHKPNPDTFLKCAELMGVSPAECQVFEDGVLGIEAAKTAGMMITDVRPFINYGEWIHS
ncbi:haloacid dehalogenase superfamily, subfamily IA, variant 3 with third motif having DD or ED/beta-phosphoglucomutase family hydrolase [Mariniphaga anaerophila]|uniref:Haloacid dehalogenase superfamily, subfamily IA, variant 3 with third motif having DD or ED/beta-phosphoglucomutase family hydrolase n=1 Tax=Mariniphaga anaerophila TaxID=1484053 RepID=A0A1M5A6Q1_9BACT|nr:HAD-IA family hydrolase [Mariniphaga anaerophila]SHF25502.1 haloacid dehalogenase superfamily, subfamily IA, variant 3 with third motif having DD or ED/beta-phosphoglucomutase family hydrolase [Mariniphaga anaerophila]